MNKDSLGDRMKAYEDIHRYRLMSRSPKVIRLDGKAFHTVLAQRMKPYDEAIAAAMCRSAEQVMRDVGGTARFAYTQSDECSIVLNDALDLETQAWFDNNVQKMASVAASIFTYRFNVETRGLLTQPAYFDARVFNLPDLNELSNYLVWRQNDAKRNSIQQYARNYFSQKEINGLKCSDILTKLKDEKDFDWVTEAPDWTRHGIMLTREGPEKVCPVFVKSRQFIITRFLPEEVNQPTPNTGALSIEQK